MTRIIFSSNAGWSNTGYGSQCRGAVKGIASLGYPIAVHAWWGVQGGPVVVDGIQHFPSQLDAYGNDAASHICRKFRADLLITLIDLWVLDPALGQIGGVRWCVPGHTEITLASGTQKTIKEIVEDAMPVDVIGWQDGKAVFAKIEAKHIIDSTLSGEIIDVQTESGHRLEVTADNLVAVDKNGQLEWLSADCLQPGMMVYCNSSRPQGGQANVQRDRHDGQDAHQGSCRATHSDADGNGMGIYRGHHRRRGDNFNNTLQLQAAERLLYVSASAELDGVKHIRGVDSMARSKDRNHNQQPITSQDYRQQPPEASTTGLLPDFGSRLPLLSDFENDRAISDRQEAAGTINHAIYRGKAGGRGRRIQCRIHGRADSVVVEGTSLEPQRITTVFRRGKPYGQVYDLTTSTGNFVAGGVLIHNCPWFPLDHADPIPPAIAERFPHAHRLLVYSRYAEREVKDYDGGRYADKVRYIPHGIQCDVLRPATLEERASFRRKLYGDWPADTFVVGMVAANKGWPCRKSFPEAMEAFALFANDHPDARLYLHSLVDNRAQGPDLQDMARHFGISDKVRLANPKMIMGGDYTDEMMHEILCSFDVLLAPSQGEGFGLPILEAQSCGVSVIVTDHSAMSELVGCGWRVKPNRLSYSLLGGKFAEADVAGIRHALEECYRRPKSEHWGQIAREFALQYDWPVVMNCWAEFLAEMDGGRRELALELEACTR